MLDTDLLQSIATQLMTSDVVEVNGKRLRVRRTSASHLRRVGITMGGNDYEAIEQNPYQRLLLFPPTLRLGICPNL